jgi:hypothetical protein
MRLFRKKKSNQHSVDSTDTRYVKASFDFDERVQHDASHGLSQSWSSVPNSQEALSRDAVSLNGSQHSGRVSTDSRSSTGLKLRLRKSFSNLFVDKNFTPRITSPRFSSEVRYSPEIGLYRHCRIVLDLFLRFPHQNHSLKPRRHSTHKMLTTGRYSNKNYRRQLSLHYPLMHLQYLQVRRPSSSRFWNQINLDTHPQSTLCIPSPLLHGYQLFSNVEIIENLNSASQV